MVPTVPTLPTVPTVQIPDQTQPSIFAPTQPKPPAQSPFGGEANGPFAPTTPAITPPATPNLSQPAPANFDPNAPAMRAVNAAPAGDLQNYARQAAQRAGINPEIFAAQIQQESGFNPNAGSSAGAQGIAQIVPQYHPGVNPLDPRAALDYAANLDRKLLDQYGGDWQKALIAYNGGGGAVAAWDRGEPYGESQTYVSQILGTSRPNQNAGQSAQQAPSGLTTGPADDAGRIFPLTVKPTNAPSATYHSQGGSDLMAPRGTPVAAMQSGKVVEVFQDKGDHQFGGNAVLIHGNDGLDYYYAHFDQPTSLHIGDQVQAGQQIGLVGNSGNAYKDGKGETHLHIGIGHGISDGVGSEGGLGLDYNAQSLLADLEKGVGEQPARTTATAGAPSAPAPTIADLDNTQRALSNGLTSRPAGSAIPPTDQIPRQAMTQFGVQQPSVTPSEDQNPWSDLGNVISGAIQRAVSGITGGMGPPGPPGGPPGDRRREEDQQRQDQFSPDTGDIGTSDFRNLSADQIDALFRNPVTGEPGAIQQATGLYTTPPRDLKEAADRALADIQRRGIPLPGPGGSISFLQPGRSLRELNPLSKGSEPTVLEDILSGVPGVLGGIARADEQGGTIINPLRSAAAGAAEGAIDTARLSAENLAKGLERNRIMQAWDWFVRNYSDRNVDLNHVAEDFARRLGRPLTDDENAQVLARVDPTHQSNVAIENALGSAMRDVPNKLQQTLQDYIRDETDNSIGEGLASRAESAFMDQGIDKGTQRAMDEANQMLQDAQQAHAQALADQRAVDLGVHRTAQSQQLNFAGQRVRNAEQAVSDAEEVARDAAARHARERTLNGPQGELVRRPEQRDLIIAQSDAKRANAAYSRLFARSDRIPIQPTGTSNAVRAQYERQLASMARQVGYAEDRVSRLQQALGENVASRGAAVEGRAAQAARAAQEASRVAPTPELAAARVRLRYEQANLDRLQAAKARGQQGLVDDLARAFQKVQKAQRDVTQAEADLPAAAKAQGWALKTGRLYGGRTWDEVQASMQRMQDQFKNDPETWGKFQNVKSALQDFRKQMLQEDVDSGLIPQEAADGMMDTFDMWTPSRQLKYLAEEGPGGLPRGNKLNVNSNGYKSYTAEGSSGELQNPIDAFIQYAQSHYDRVAKNDAFNAVVDAQGGPGGALRRIADNMQEYIDAKGGLLHPDYKPRIGDGERKLTGFIDGKKQEYITDNPALHAAIENVQAGDHPIIKVLRPLAHLTRETAVSRNPLWLAANSLSDAFGYGMRTTKASPSQLLNLGPAALTAAMTDPNDPEREDKIKAALVAGVGSRALIGNRLGLGPSATREFMLAYGDVLRGLGSGRMTGEGVQELWRRGGGMRGGGYAGYGPKAAEEYLQQLTKNRAYSVRNLKDLRDLFNDAILFGWNKALGDRFEQAPRVAMMRLRDQQGFSPLRSMIAARDASIDFDRGGNFVRALNSAIPFLNASAQGGAQLGRLVRDAGPALAFAGTSLVGIPTALADIYNYSDPQREDDYNNVPDYIKRQGPVLMRPGEAPRDANGNRVPQYLQFNTREFSPFAIAAHEAVKRALGKGTPRNAAQIMQDIALQELPGGLMGSPSETLSSVLPAGFGTAYQLSQNRDLYRDASIANQYSDESASNVGKALAPLLENIITQVPGQSADRIRPSQVDFAIKDAFNGLGQTGLNITDQLTGRAARVPGAASNIPLVGGAVGRFVRGTGGQNWQDVQAPEAMLAPDIRRNLRSLGGSTAYYEPSAVPSTYQRVPLRQAEQVQYQRLTNQYLDQYMRRMMTRSGWDRSDTVREKLISAAMDAARKKAGGEVIRQIRASGSNLHERMKQQSSAL